MTPKRSDSEAAGLRDFLKRVGSYARDLIYGVPPDKYLFHYTDLNGLQGILSNADLWLTDSRYLNDSEEMRHGTPSRRECSTNGPRTKVIRKSSNT